MTPDPSTIDGLRSFYASGGRVADVVAEVRRRIDALADPALFVGPLAADLDERADALDAGDRSRPLHGVPFVVKDNIDVAGTRTTAGCPAYGRTPSSSAAAVRLLVDAGAVFVGKVNLDQFATGLVGTRSPFGTPRNVLDPSIVPGGSSSGSAVAVAAGLVAFALGTDTAGSGRVPAAMNQVVGLKPTRGLVSTVGVVPACASLDCVSVFASSARDAWDVFAVLDRPDRDDPWRRHDHPGIPIVRADRLRVGVPGPGALADVDAPVVASFERQVDALVRAGATTVPIDLAPFLDAGRRLYGGPFVAERYAAVGGFVEEHGEEVIEPTRSIIAGGGSHSAAALHRAQELVQRRREEAAAVWDEVDVLAVPTVPTAPTLEEVAADPIGVNTCLGRFTTFANLLDLAALTVPDRSAPTPGAGATVYGPAGADARLAAVGATLLGEVPLSSAPRCTDLVVVGAHLEGGVLNHQLAARGGVLVGATTTAPVYRLWALPDRRRPALERATGPGGAAIEVEVWSVPAAALGEVVAEVTPPLAIGTVVLEGGVTALGFVCEMGGLEGAVDITAAGGWRAHLRGVS